MTHSPSVPALVRGRRRALMPGALGLTALLTLSACGAGPDGGTSPEGAEATSSAPQGEVVAVATTTQLGSVLGQITDCVGTGSAAVMGPGDDPHDFSASSQQVAQMAGAEMVFANGLGLEAGLEAALSNAAADGATILEVAPELDPLPFTAVDGHDDHAGETAEEHAEHADEAEGDAHDGHDHGPLDPHVWMDVGRMAQAAEVMGEALAQQTGEPRYADCGGEVKADLAEVDQQVAQILAEIPEDRRTLVTDHAAYNYLADAYGLEVSGVVIPGGSTDAEPSSQELAALVDQIRDSGADALLTSVGAGSSTVQAVAQEVGDVPVVELYESGIGPAGSGAETYAEAMVFNARALADALT
ncbi:metal ABC transporter substrate-binding protein [Micrococcus terreus]|uniref:metal ABC transporter substrate-binding protein n=1 Tax=Micrococcus terreus TaxID=574650 RepID=UPI00255176A0|nr:metal ABC transporter substrate-binding protein [Micrococcus terreus]MDK7702202.1 metal ABC transporter substrate-binding protein [Micrococcus terreus]WOO97932.1 metal ABC transporter substrate-binding protein [Micrococcus terreus]